MHYGDMTDCDQPDPPRAGDPADEIYNLAAQSHVQVSASRRPEYTANADALGTLRLLEAIRILGMEKETRFYQASTSELYGKVQEVPQKRDDAVLSALALWRRQALCLLDHGELPRGLWHARLQRHPVQPRRPDARRDLRHAQDHPRASPRIELGLQERLYLGNLDAKRDWGHARDYVEGMWLMLQQTQPDDYVLATGEMHSVREFVELAFAEVGRTHRLARQGRRRERRRRQDRQDASFASIRAISARPRSICCSATPPRRARSSAGSRRRPSRELVTEMVASDLAISRSGETSPMAEPTHV